MRQKLKGVLGVALLISSSSFAGVLYENDFNIQGSVAPGSPLSDNGWGGYVTAADTSVLDISNIDPAVGETWGGTSRGNAGGTANTYLYISPKGEGSVDPGVESLLFSTDLGSSISLTNIGSFSVNESFDGSTEDSAKGRFVIQIGADWYASTQEWTSETEDGSPAAGGTIQTLTGIDFTDGNNWLELTVAPGIAGVGEITLGTAVGGTLTGDVSAFGVYIEHGNGGDHARIDDFLVEDNEVPPPGPSFDLLYSQPFYKNSGGTAAFTGWGWTSVVESVSGVVENPTYADKEVEAVAGSNGAADEGAFNAVWPSSPTNAGVKGYAFYAPKQDADYSGNALFYTLIPTNSTVTGLQKLRVDQRNDNTDSVLKFAIQVDSQWYASAEDFGGANGSYATKEMVVESFASKTNWVELTVSLGGGGEITLGSEPVSDLSGIITAYGLYADSGTTPEAGDHIRFDNFQVYGSTSTAPPSEPPVIETVVSGGDMIISWTESGFKLQTRASLTDGDWVDVPEGNVSPFILPMTNNVEFLRLVWP